MNWTILQVTRRAVETLLQQCVTIETNWATLLIIGLNAAVTIILSVLIWQMFTLMRTRFVTGSSVDQDQIRLIAEQVGVIRRQQLAIASRGNDAAARHTTVEETR